MKLNNSFLAVQWETDPYLKDFYRREHSKPEHIPTVFKSPEDKFAWMAGRMTIIDEMCNSKGVKMFYITQTAQDAAAHIKYSFANMKWLRQVKDQRSLYVTSKYEFFRFIKTDNKIMVLQYSITNVGQMTEYVGYEGFALDLLEEELKMLPSQDQEIAHRFIKLLMFIEMSKVEVVKVEPKHKVKYGKGGDDKLYNDSDLKNVYLVNALWNKIIVVQGEFRVSGHFRVQPCGAGRKDYKLIWIEEFTKGSYVRRAGKEIIE